MKNFILPLTVIAFLSSCSSYLTSSMNVTETKKVYDKVLVLAKSKDQLTRLKFEQSAVKHLGGKGIEGVASSELNETKGLKSKLSESEITDVNKALLKMGFDGAIITSLIDTQQYTDIVPGNANTINYPVVHYGRFTRYYDYYPITYWEPDQQISGTKYILESTLYRISDSQEDNLHWVGRFEVKDPSNIDKTINAYAKQLVNAVVEESMVSNKP